LIIFTEAVYPFPMFSASSIVSGSFSFMVSGRRKANPPETVPNTPKTTHGRGRHSSL